jgi:ribosome-associated protein
LFKKATGGRFLDSLDLAHKAVEAASDKQASDIVLLDVREICGFTGYFVICTGETHRQVAAIAEGVQQALKKEDVSPRHQEGTPESGWVLLDYGDVIVHIFSSFERDRYQLDQLWEKACTVVRVP